MSSVTRTFTRAKKREDNRKERLKANAGKATKWGFFGDGSRVKWLYKSLTGSAKRMRKPL